MMKLKPLMLALLLFLSVNGLAMAQQPGAQTQTKLPKAAVDVLVGSWFGPVAAGAATVTFLVDFKVQSNGDLQGTLSIPESGATLPISDIEFADNKLSFKVPVAPGVYTASYTGGSFDGLWRQGDPLAPPEGIPVVLKKGTYVALSHALKLSAETFGQLAGTWNGSLDATTPQGQVTLPIALRFEINKQGERVAFMDSPSQHATGIPVTEASLSGGKLVVRVEVLQGEYDATLSGNALAGEWMQNGASIPLTMTRK